MLISTVNTPSSFRNEGRKSSLWRLAYSYIHLRDTSNLNVSTIQQGKLYQIHRIQIDGTSCIIGIICADFYKFPGGQK